MCWRRFWWRVVLRRGMVGASVCLGGGLPRVTISAVGWQSSGKSSRLPGWVVMVLASGSVQTMVPSGYCWLDQPGQKV
jgi:hypothetical protein